MQGKGIEGACQKEKLIKRKNQISNVNIVRHWITMKKMEVGVASLKKKRIIGIDVRILFGNTIFRRILK